MTNYSLKYSDFPTLKDFWEAFHICPVCKGYTYQSYNDSVCTSSCKNGHSWHFCNHCQTRVKGSLDGMGDVHICPVIYPLQIASHEKNQ